MSVRIINADVLEGLRQLPDESVHCVVTSPPYYGLRDYGVDGQIGLEPTPAAFVARLVEVFREVRRVLRADGTCWVNIGDSYARSGGAGWQGKNGQRADRNFTAPEMKPAARDMALKPKDLIGIPWRLAFALQDDGWWLRQEIIWQKPNPMPESVTDRCTKAHEQIFLLAKSERYFFDNEAIKERAAWPDGPNSPESIKSPYGQGFARTAIGAKGNAKTFRGGGAYTNNQVRDNSSDAKRDSHGNAPNETLSRNKRSVWSIATTPFPEAHFATFPPELPATCIKAGTSQHGCCATCGAPWERQTERTAMVVREGPGRAGLQAASMTGTKRTATTGTMLAPPTSKTVGWCPTCACEAQAVPCTVLDPFGGAGTTGLVADRLQRNAVLIEINPTYAAMAERRINGDRGGLLDLMETAS